MRLTHKNQGGFTLVEVTIILIVLVILSMIILPQMGNFNRLARKVKVNEDLQAICTVMKKMLDEVMLGTFYKQPRDREGPVGLLVGPGDIPVAGANNQPNCNGDGRCQGGELHWRLPVGQGSKEMDTDDGNATVRFEVRPLSEHLMENDPSGYGDRRNPGYKNPLDDPQRWAAGAFSGWRGSYLTELTTDPWNNRYAVNTFALYKPPDQRPRSIFTSAVVCCSAGPDGGVDTGINQPINDNDGDSHYGWRFIDDDQGVMLSAGGAM